MKNGWTEKYDAHLCCLNNPELAKIRADMEVSGSDANPGQWDQLNDAVDALPAEPKEPTKDAGIAGNAEGGVTDNGRLVSKDKPGTGSNPIGYPGTDQDQDGPGKASKTVPGMKPTKKPGE